jgi:hypothetical protein
VEKKPSAVRVSTMAAVVWLMAACMPLAAVAQETAVLDLHAGSYRGYVRYGTPRLVGKDGAPRPLLEDRRRGQKEEDRKPVGKFSLASPPVGWKESGFDDARWPRVRGVLASDRSRAGSLATTWMSTGIAQVCARGAFRVTDPSVVGDLTLDLRYLGGCVVYVNGREVARGHLPAGELTRDTLAEPYPMSAYVNADGKIHDWRHQLKLHDNRQYRRGVENSELGKLRFRSLKGVKIPREALRKGINVVVVDVRTSPLRGEYLTGQAATPWGHAGLLEAFLRASGPSGLEPNVGSRPGLAVQAVGPFEDQVAWDYALPTEAPSAVAMTGVRGGVFSGKVLVSSSEAIRGLKASMSTLALEGGGSIPDSAVSVRWSAGNLNPLQETLPGGIRPVKFRPTPTASGYVWVTVRVPRDAGAGLYRGRLEISAFSPDSPARVVPVELEVHDWLVPEPKDWATQHLIYQSPESVARYYKVPLWSDRHFDLIGKSFEALYQVGNKVLPLDLMVDNYHSGNRESMVRWVKDGKGGFTHDFTIVEKYMDVYQAKCGDPGVVYLAIWSHADFPTKKMPLKKVTVFDPATGELSAMDPPPLGTPESEAFYRPMMDELRKRLEKRGWFEKAAVAYSSYSTRPSQQMVDVYRRIWPEGKWINRSHVGEKGFGGMPVSWCEWVWGCGQLYGGWGRGYPRPWKRLGSGWISLANPRAGTGLLFSFHAHRPPSAYRFISEACVQGDVNGLGVLGADFWPCIPDSRGRMRPMIQGAWGVGFDNTIGAMLAPGKDGAVFNGNLEMFREGVQIAEAIVACQRGLESGKLGAELVRKIEDLLDERARYYLHTRDAEVQKFPWWSLESSAWRERDRQLYALAGEVAKALK